MYTRVTMSMNDVWDVIVIGGGPAGMMAAAAAAAIGKQVLLLEKNPSLGKKLLITGGGRCNVTNNKPIVRDMLSQYKGDGKFLFSAFMQHGAHESIDWFERRGVSLTEENEGRLFPVTNTAKTINDTLVTELKATGVTIKNNFTVAKIQKEDGLFCVSSLRRDVVKGRSCVVAAGGTSRPETGSTGEGYAWLETLGHTIVPNNFALVPLKIKESFVSRLSGITLNPTTITVFSDGKKHSSQKGKLLFTHTGVTGPTILNLSQTVGELLGYSTVTLGINLLPQFDAGECKQHLQRLFTDDSNKKLKNILSSLIPSALVTVILEILEIDGETPGHSVSTNDRKRLREGLQSFPLTVRGLEGANKAVISAGGVTLEEIDFKTMESKVIPGLYIVGDMLNIDRPSGGYSLQLCWTTGFVAGTHAGTKSASFLAQ